MEELEKKGLAIYKSMFAGINGARGCVGGPHELFRQCERQFLESNNNGVAQFKVFVQQQIQLFNTGIRVCLDVGMLNTSQFQHARFCAAAVINADTVNNQTQECDKTSRLEVVEDAGASDAGENDCLAVAAAANTIVSENSNHEHADDEVASEAPESCCKPVVAAGDTIKNISS